MLHSPVTQSDFYFFAFFYFPLFPAQLVQILIILSCRQLCLPSAKRRLSFFYAPLMLYPILPVVCVTFSCGLFLVLTVIFFVPSCRRGCKQPLSSTFSCTRQGCQPITLSLSQHVGVRCDTTLFPRTYNKRYLPTQSSSRTRLMSISTGEKAKVKVPDKTTRMKVEITT